jgi:hypothetical protein
MSTPPFQTPPATAISDEDDFISLAPLWGLVRRYRRWLEVGFFALLILAGGLVAAAYLALPQKVRTSLEFTLTFPDAALGSYPNKLPFRSGDLLETSLIQRVYGENGLDAYLKFDEFKAGLSLERAGIDLELLQQEFRARLDDRKLTLADREKIEADYDARRKVLPATVYRLNFFQRARSARLLPPARRTKVLEDILRLWSDDAVLQKKVLVFAARLPGEMSLPEAGRDPLIALMELMERSRTLAEGLGELTRLPGGYQASLADGTRLADLLLRLEGLQEGRIPQIRSALFGNITDPVQAANIERVFRLQVRMREDRLRLAQENLRGAVSTYRDYLASRPEAFSASGNQADAGAKPATAGVGTQLQISDTFLTKLIDLGRGSEDSSYRASLVDKIRLGRLQVADEASALRETREIVEGLRENKPAKDKVPASAKDRQEAAASSDDFNSVLLQGARELNALILDSEKIRMLITQNYMSPRTSLYRITVPVLAESSTALTPRNAGLFLAVFVFLGLGLMLVVCWAHDQSAKPQA